jgi:hypothetical protein
MNTFSKLHKHIQWQWSQRWHKLSVWHRDNWTFSPTTWFRCPIVAYEKVVSHWRMDHIVKTWTCGAFSKMMSAWIRLIWVILVICSGAKQRTVSNNGFILRTHVYCNYPSELCPGYFGHNSYRIFAWAMDSSLSPHNMTHIPSQWADVVYFVTDMRFLLITRSCSKSSTQLTLENHLMLEIEVQLSNACWKMKGENDWGSGFVKAFRKPSLLLLRLALQSLLNDYGLD